MSKITLTTNMIVSFICFCGAPIFSFSIIFCGAAVISHIFQDERKDTGLATAFWITLESNTFYNRKKSILGQNATFFRGTLEKMPSKDLQNCPRNVERSSSSEDSFGGPRTASFPESQGKRWHFNIIPWLCRFSSDQIQNDVIFQLFPPEISVTLR